jgi:hypothetical protein
MIGSMRSLNELQQRSRPLGHSSQPSTSYRVSVHSSLSARVVHPVVPRSRPHRTQPPSRSTAAEPAFSAAFSVAQLAAALTSCRVSSVRGPLGHSSQPSTSYRASSVRRFSERSRPFSSGRSVGTFAVASSCRASCVRGSGGHPNIQQAISRISVL